MVDLEKNVWRFFEYHRNATWIIIFQNEVASEKAGIFTPGDKIPYRLSWWILSEEKIYLIFQTRKASAFPFYT